MNNKREKIIGTIFLLMTAYILAGMFYYEDLLAIFDPIQ